MRGTTAAWGMVAALAAAGCASAEGGEEASAKPDGGTAAVPAPAADPWAGTGFSVWDVDGRWWVFREGSKEGADFLKGGEPAKQVTRIADGRTLKAVDAETLDAFLAWRPGFAVHGKGGRIWVFRQDSKELAEFTKSGDLAKHVTRIGAGPNGATLKAPDVETLDAWAAAGR